MESNNRLHELPYSHRRFFIAILRRTRDGKRHPFIKYTMDIRSRSYGSRPDIHGLSHGLKIARQLSIFTPVCGLVPPFRIPIRWQKEKPHRMVWFFFLAEDEGFEPPQTESESGVLPLHKSSKRNDIIIRTSLKKSSVF